MSKDNFYKFKHECDMMPENVVFCQLSFSRTSQFTHETYDEKTGHHSATLYGFKFCPYCGEKVVNQ